MLSKVLIGWDLLIINCLTDCVITDCVIVLEYTKVRKRINIACFSFIHTPLPDMLLLAIWYKSNDSLITTPRHNN